MGAPPGPRRVNQAAAATGPPRPRDTGRSGVRALESPAHVRVPAAGGRRGNSRRSRAPRTHPLARRPRCAPGHRPAVRAPRSREWFRGPPRPATRLRWRGTSSWPRAPQSTVARIRNPPAPTRLARRLPRARIAPGPRGRSPRSRSGRSPGCPSRPPTACHRRARADRLTDRVSPRQVSRRAAPVRHARRRRGDRRCRRWLRRPLPPVAHR